MTSVITWNDDVMHSLRDVRFYPRAVNREGATSLRGKQQIHTTGEHVWTMTLFFDRETNIDRVRQYEAAVAQMNGRANIAELRIPDPYGYVLGAPAPLAISGGVTVDGTYFADPDDPATLTVGSGCAVGETQITVSPTATAPQLAVGQHFSFDGFLYRVIGVSGATITFLPRARSAITTSSTLNTDPLIVRARFASDLGGDARRELGWIREPVEIDFVEAFDR